ncbi:MAG: hypothetical protein MI867_27005, partial [Pseudomonadales bacterium]|nr:hypothetical protein [Pseudomonadales bacterium]
SLVILFSLGVFACGGGTYTIESPTEGSIFNDAPDFTVGYEEEPEALPSMILNGNTVTSEFAKNATQAIGLGADLQAFLVEGNNRFQVNPPSGPQVNFIYDTQGPKIVVTEAIRNGNVTITGNAVDAAGASSVSVNGVAAELAEDGSFSVVVSAADTYTFQATDVFDQSSTTVFGDALLINEELIKARVKEEGIDFIADELVGVVNGLDFNALVAGTELYKSGIFRGELTSLELQAESFSLDPTNNGLSLSGVFTDVRARLRLVQIFVVKPTARVERVILSGNVQVGVNSNNELEAVINTLDVDAQNISFEGALGGLDRFLGGIIGGLVGLFENQIGNAVKGAVNNTLEDKLADLIPTSYDLGVSCRELGIEFELRDIITNNDSIIIELAGGILPNTVTSAIPQALGPLYTTDPLPSPNFGDGDMSFAINANAINQALVSIYSVGLTHLMLLNGDTYINVPRDDGLGSESDSRILIDTLTPPQVLISEEGGEAVTTIDISQLRISSQVKEDGQWNETFNLLLSAQVEASLAIDSDNTLSVTISDDPVVTVLDTVVAGGVTIGENLINRVIQDSIPSIMNNISTSINGIEIPSIAGFSITSDSISAIGANNSHVGISGTLNKLPGDASDSAGDTDGESGGGSGDISVEPDANGEVICFP